MEKKLLKKESIAALLEALQRAGKHVYAPCEREGRVDFAAVKSAGEIAADYVQTVQSAKTVFFPKVEKLFAFKNDGKSSEVADRAAEPFPEIVLFGVRPCDAAAVDALRAIFTWDYQDVFFKTRLEKTAIIGLSCAKGDDFCFCTSMGGDPGDTRGSDILLTRLSGGDYLAEIVSEKGRALAAAAPELFLDPPAEAKEANLARIEKRFDGAAMREKLQRAFDDIELWTKQSLRCLGCGACAYVCPACACFDIQDEGTPRQGQRLRCWDSCGFGQFTLHTSGHNPREIQSQRWRQRVMHKLAYMPDRLQVSGCVGCGRCSRSCPVDMNLCEHIQAIAEANV